MNKTKIVKEKKETDLKNKSEQVKNKQEPNKEKGSNLSVDETSLEQNTNPAEETKHEEYTKEQIEEASQAVSKQKSKKKKIMNLLFFLVNIAVVAAILVIQLQNETVAPIQDLKVNGWFILVIFLVFAGIMWTEGARFNFMIKRDSGRSRWGLSYKTAAIGRYYDCVTPMATGGQPFQIFYLSSHDIKTTTALSLPITKYVFQQFTWVILSFIAVVVGSSGISGVGAQVVGAAAIIGFCLNFALVFFVVLISSSKTVGKKLVIGGLKLLQKLHIVKNFEKQYTKVMKMVSDYQTIIKSFAKSKLSFFVMLFLSILAYFLMYSMPYFIYCAFAGWHPEMWWQIFVMSMLIDLAASFIPLPGGTGASELSFTALFGSLFAGTGTLFWALIFWRTMSYYIYIVQGIMIIIYDYVYGNKKYMWDKKRFELEGESKLFRQAQIQKFRKERNKRRKQKSQP